MRIAIVDRQSLVREALRNLLDSDSFQVVASVEHFSRLCEKLETEDIDPQVVLFDFGMDHSPVHQDILRLKELRPAARVLALSDELCVEKMVSCFQTNFDGFLLKDISAPALRQSIELVMLGQKVFPTELLAWIAARIPSYVYDDVPLSTPSSALSNREVRILEHLVHGHQNKVIANHLSITEGTVKVHLKAILKKINARNRTQAAIWALHHGLGGDTSGSVSDSPQPAKRDTGNDENSDGSYVPRISLTSSRVFSARLSTTE